MNIVQFLASFFYRIRYWLLWGSLLVTALVIAESLLLRGGQSVTDEDAAQ